jgi:hypothetical protein
MVVERSSSIGWIENLGRFWCRYMHFRPSWPVGGHYQCLICLRRYPVPWEQPRQYQGKLAAPLRSRFQPEWLEDRAGEPSTGSLERLLF